MAVNIPAVAVVTTKLADGNVQFMFYTSLDGVNNTGQIRFGCVMTAANVTAINTTVNGGASGATLTQAYAQDANRGDYPTEYVASV